MKSARLSKLLAVGLAAIAATFAQAQEVTWRPLYRPLYEPGSGGRIAGLGVSPHDSNHVIVTGDMLGIGVSFDRGDSWRSSFGLPSYECAEVTFHPTDPDVSAFSAMDAGNFWVSTDGMRTWTKGQGELPKHGGGDDIAFAGASDVFVALGQSGNFHGIGRSTLSPTKTGTTAAFTNTKAETSPA